MFLSLLVIFFVGFIYEITFVLIWGSSCVSVFENSLGLVFLLCAFVVWKSVSFTFQILYLFSCKRLPGLFDYFVNACLPGMHWHIYLFLLLFTCVFFVKNCVHYRSFAYIFLIIYFFIRGKTVHTSLAAPMTVGPMPRTFRILFSSFSN